MQLVRSIEADNSQRIQSARARRKIADPDGLRSSKRRRGRSASADAVAPPVDSGLEPGELTQEEWPTLTPPPPPTDPPPVPPPPHPHWRWRLPFGLTSVHNGEVPVVRHPPPLCYEPAEARSHVEAGPRAPDTRRYTCCSQCPFSRFMMGLWVPLQRRGGRVPSDGVYGDRTEYMVKAVLDHNLPRGNNGNDYESARWKVRHDPVTALIPTLTVSCVVSTRQKSALGKGLVKGGSRHQITLMGVDHAIVCLSVVPSHSH